MVLVSHTHKLIYLKTRKTAGTSVEMLLEAATGLGPVSPTESRHAMISDAGLVGFRRIPRNTFSDLDMMWRPHTSAQKLRDFLGSEIWDRYLKVTSLRNPFDRMISLFHWQQSNSNPATRNETFRGFADFIRQKWSNDRDIAMIDDTFVPDVIIHYETLPEDLARLSECTDMALDPQRLPRTKNRHQRRLGAIADYYTEELADVVRTRLAWIFDHGGYARKLPAPQTQEHHRQKAKMGDDL